MYIYGWWSCVRSCIYILVYICITYTIIYVLLYTNVAVLNQDPVYISI
jgi:hypothetical protein